MYKILIYERKCSRHQIFLDLRERPWRANKSEAKRGDCIRRLPIFGNRENLMSPKKRVAYLLVFFRRTCQQIPQFTEIQCRERCPLYCARGFSRGLEHERTLVSSIFFSFSFSLTPLVDRPLVDNCSAKPPRETSGPQISCLSLKNRQMKMSLTVPIIK